MTQKEKNKHKKCTTLESKFSAYASAAFFSILLVTILLGCTITYHDTLIMEKFNTIQEKITTSLVSNLTASQPSQQKKTRHFIIGLVVLAGLLTVALILDSIAAYSWQEIQEYNDINKRKSMLVFGLVMSVIVVFLVILFFFVKKSNSPHILPLLFILILACGSSIIFHSLCISIKTKKKNKKNLVNTKR